ncbi:MAG: 5-formyltetrahydrofolate cyclo-ligase [Clostridia bacterium]|nr:5-formyltetrahydrofolate cyclo-ligase [Clostridia bacterium]
MNDVMNIAQIKKKMRGEYAAMRVAIPVNEKKERDLNIAQQLFNSQYYKSAQEILCYVSTENEIDTKLIITDAIKRGKSVFVPKCMEQKGVMRFYLIHSLGDLKSGKYGILEPDCTTADEWHKSNENTLCIVPALCCDGNGNRLGYGGGYYDRFLCDFTGIAVCLCYAEFSDVDLPCEQYDVACKVVIKG